MESGSGFPRPTASLLFHPLWLPPAPLPSLSPWVPRRKRRGTRETPERVSQRPQGPPVQTALARGHKVAPDPEPSRKAAPGGDLIPSPQPPKACVLSRGSAGLGRCSRGGGRGPGAEREALSPQEKSPRPSPSPCPWYFPESSPPPGRQLRRGATTLSLDLIPQLTAPLSKEQWTMKCMDPTQGAREDWRRPGPVYALPAGPRNLGHAAPRAGPSCSVHRDQTRGSPSFCPCSTASSFLK